MSQYQLPLDLGHRPLLGGADFLVTDCNAEAAAWLDRWPAWPAPALCLFGPAGAGKTHLAHMFAERTGAVLLAARALSLGQVPDLAVQPAVVVEDADRGVLEVALFHLYNACKEAGTRLLLTARLPPARWPLTLPDLRSRLNAAPAVPIRPPDDALMAALLLKLFADRQLKVGQDVLAYALPRLERSFAAIQHFVAQLDALALAERRPITVPLARRVLETHDERQGELGV